MGDKGRDGGRDNECHERKGLIYSVPFLQTDTHFDYLSYGNYRRNAGVSL